MLPLFGLIVALSLTMALIPPCIKAAGYFHVIDIPDARKIHAVTMPRIGGIAMIIGSVIPIVMWSPVSPLTVSLLIGTGIIFVFGVWDDRVQLNYKVKLAGQLAAVLVVVGYGGVLIERLPFCGLDPMPHYLTYPITILVLVGITNAINLSDGLDGLAGGTTFLSLGCIALFAYASSGYEVTLVAMSVIGSIIGFLRFNTYPARVFMGDTGSQFLGFSAGVLAVLVTQRVNPVLSPALPIIILGLPILDTLTVMGQRIYQGRSPFLPDQNHIHHKLLSLGFDHYEAVIIIYMAQALLVTCAYVLRYASDGLVVGVYLTFLTTVLAAIGAARIRGWKIRHDQPDANSFIALWLRRLRANGVLENGPLYFCLLFVPGFLVVAPFVPEAVPKDFSVVSIALLIIALALLALRSGPPKFVDRGIIYVTCAFAVYLFDISTTVSSQFASLTNIFYVALAVMVAAGIRFSVSRTFEVTPLDFLVIFIAVTVPNLSTLSLPKEHLGALAIRLIVLFYASEYILTRANRRINPLFIAAIFSLGMIAVRGVL